MSPAPHCAALIVATSLAASLAAAAPAADGRLIYPVSGGTTPQHRGYTASTNAFSANANTIAGATNAGWFVDRAAPTRNEHLAGYVTTGGVLYVLRWNGTAWSAEWNVTVGGNGVDGRRFDIAYEDVSGDAVVVYSNNTTGTNELRYRIWNGSTWTAATTLDSARLTATPAWVKMLPRPASDELALTVADNGTTTGNNCRLTTLIWSGTAWGNEPGAAHSTSLYSTTGQLIQNELFDMAWETTTGSLMVVFTQSASAGQYYRRFSGTWGNSTAFGSTRTPPLQMFAASDPTSANIVAGFNRSGSTNVYAQVWTGAAWSTLTTVGSNGATTAIRSRTVTAKWLAVGGTSYPVVLWGTGTAGTVGSNRATVSGTTVTWGTAATQAFSGTFGAWAWMDSAVDPVSGDTLELTFSDANSDLWARRLVLTAGPTLTWTADSSAALSTTLQGVTSQNFAFAHNRFGSSLTLGNALTTDAPSATICYDAADTDLDYFTLLASAADNVTGVTVALTGTTAALSTLTVTNDASAVILPTVANPVASNVITFTTPFAAPTGTALQYRLKITPNPAAAAGTYTFTGNVTAVTDSAGFSKLGADLVAGTITVDNAPPGEVAALNASAVTFTSMTVGWTNPGTDFSSAMVVRGTAPVTGVPVKGSSYLVGAQLPGFADAAEQVVATGVTTGTFADSGLTAATTYYYRVFVLDACGIWSPVGTQLSQATLTPVLTIGDGTPVPTSAVVCPGDSTTRDVSAFTLVASPAGNSDTVSSLTVDFTNGAVNAGAALGIGTASVTNDAATTTYASVASPADSQAFPLAPTIGVTTASAQYHVRVLAQSHAGMPAPPGANYPVTAIVTAASHANAGTVTYGNTIAGSGTITVDNSSSSDVTLLAATAPAAGQTSVTWSNPAVGTSPNDFGAYVVVLRNTASITDSPAEGTASYTAGLTIGTSSIACVGNIASCAQSGLPGGTTYFYKVFTRDSCNNWSVGAQTSVTTLDIRTTTAAPGATITSCTTASLSAPFTGDSNTNGSTLFERGSSGTGPWTTACAAVAGASPRACAVSGLTNNTAAYFRVTFTDADGLVGTNPQVIGPFTTFDCRVAPGTPTATPNSCSQITVSAPFTGDWNTNSTSTFAHGPSATGPWTAASCGVISGASPHSCTDVGLVASTGYYFQVTYSDADGVNGSAAVVTASTSTPACASNLTITTVGQPAGGSVTAGSAGNYVGKMTLSASGGAITVTDVAVANTGSGLSDSDFLSLVLFADANANGVYDVLTDTTVVGTAVWNATSSRYLARNMGFVVTNPTTQTLFFTLNVASSAATGATFAMQVASTDVTVVAPNTVSGTTVAGNTFTVAAAPAPGGAYNAPMVLILNPAEGATVSGNFRVQVQVDNPGGAALTALGLSKNGGADAYGAYTFNLTTDKKTQYSVGLNAAVYETTIPVAPSVGGWAAGAYTLKVQATNASGSSTSGAAVINVKPSGTGDGNLLVRDNGSQLCIDCHAIPTHSSQSTSYQYGAWGVNCRNCHQPHNTKNIFLVRPQIGTPNSGGKAVSFYNTTGVAANSFATSTGPTIAGNGVCEVCHTRTANAAVTGAATATFTASSTSVTCVGSCGWTSALVGSLVKRAADPSTAWTLITAATATTLTLEAGGYRGTTGAAMAYATRSPRFRNTGDNAQHYPGNCVSCHAHSSGFGGSSCLGCHGTTGVETDDLGASFWNNAIKATFNTDEWNYSGHGKATGTYDVTGTVAAAFSTAPSAGSSECMYCHDDSTGHNPGDAANPFRLRGASVSGGATGVYSTAAPNAPCLNCHLTGSFGVTPSGQAGKNGTKKPDAAHDGVKHTVATLGGKFCWDCHDPHGDRSSALVGNITMVRNSVQVVTDGTYGYLGAAGVSRAVTYELRTATPPGTGKVVELTTPAGTDHVGLCQACHGDTSETNWTKYWNRLGYDDTNGPPNTDRVASAHNSTSATTPYCISCHAHAQKFKGAGACTDCHASPQPITVGPLAGTRDRRAIVSEFAAAWSHKRSAAGAVTKFDCIVCHMEGDMASGDTTPAHANGLLDLRDPDLGTTIKGVTWGGTGAGLYTSTAVDAVPPQFSRDLASATIEPDVAAIMINQCLKCHDANGAASSTAWVPTTGTATKPFGTTIAGAAYTGAGVTAGGVLGGVTDINESFKTTNSSYHPVSGKQNNWFTKLARMKAPWNTATRGATVDNTSWGNLISCWDCHAPPGATGVQTVTVTAHGAAATLRGTATVTGTPSVTNAVTLCVVCHAGYDTNTTANHGAVGTTAAENLNRSEKIPFMRYGCNMCHSSGYFPAAVRPVRSLDAHGSSTLPATGVALTGNWAAAGPVGGKPYAFIRNRSFLGNHSPKLVNGVAPAVPSSCDMSGANGDGASICKNQGSKTYTAGGTY